VRSLLRIYEATISVLAAVAGAITVAIFFAVVYDATVRNLGLQPPAWTVPSSEYGLLYITLLAAPWLLRTKRQVVVESVRMLLPAAVRRPLEIVIYVGCFLICLVITWFGLAQAADAWSRGDIDLRAIPIPLYVAYLPFGLAFLLMGVEFLRLLSLSDTLYAQTADPREKT
jgi:TRAP-type C4-dicarboxylate transport system permease small subunit